MSQNETARKPDWSDIIGPDGALIPVTAEWIYSIGLAPSSNGAEVPTSEYQEPIRLAIGMNKTWHAAVLCSIGVVALCEVKYRYEVLQLCAALRVTLPAPIVKPSEPSKIII